MAPGSERDVLNRAKTFVICNASATNLRINPDFSAVFGYLNVNLSSPRANLTYPRDNRFFLLENGSEILYNIEKSERGAEMKNGKICILIADDEKEIRDILRLLLTGEGYAVCTAENGKEALVLASAEVDLYLLDVNMPELSGFMAGSEIRKQFNAPIIFLTAKTLKEDILEGFKIGADDYITKPFSMEELTFRIEAILRRVRGKKNKESNIYKIGKFTFDTQKQILSSEGKQTKLTTKESELLGLLCAHANEILQRDFALKTIWIDDNYFNARSMDVYITKLRKHLKEDDSIEIINIHGKGYKLITPEVES